VAPYIILSVAFATLNARLHLPPFSLFLVALTLTDGKDVVPLMMVILTSPSPGMTMTFFYNVTDTGEIC
jgi:phosphatidylinositol glycan class N